MYQPQYQAQPQLQYVGVGMRFLALLIDGIILGVVSGILGVIFVLPSVILGEPQPQA